jgi:hypothetical protein
MQEDIQNIAVDIGRGYTKYYSEYNGKIYKGMFKSIIGESRPLDFKDYDNPICIECNGESYFCGSLAELESHQSVRNSGDSKTSLTVQVLINAILSKIAMTDNVNIMLGVPYNMYKKSVLLDVIETYQGKKITVKDKINNNIKMITINAIDIFKEADSIMVYVTDGSPDENIDIAFISVGFRSTEISYYSKGHYVDKYSYTIPFGNQTILATVQDKLKDRGIIHDLNYIDSNVGDYDDLKARAYKLSQEVLTQKIEEIIKNSFSECKIIVGGGTALKMELDSRFELIEDAQFAVVIGLYKVAEITF